MSQENIKLAWDIRQSRVVLNGIAVTVIPEKLATAKVAAIVEEQDTCLVLAKPGRITIIDDKPSWFLANQLESQQVLQPGSVVVRDGNPDKLLAIVHDLDCDPSWAPEWISQALDNIFMITISRETSSLRLPVLGAQHGRFELAEFLSLLFHKINSYNGPLKQIWLVVPLKDCPLALSYLEEIGK